MADIQITKEDVYNKLLKLNISKYPGPDNSHPQMLKELAEELCTPLSIIFNKTLSEEVLPEDWKCADITANHNKGDKHVPNNYRPIQAAFN